MQSSLENKRGNTSQLILWCQHYLHMQDKKSTRKLQTKIRHKYRCKNPQQMSVKQIQYYIERMIYHNQVGVSWKCKAGSILEKSRKDFFLHFLLAYIYFYFKAIMKNLKAKKKKKLLTWEFQASFEYTLYLQRSVNSRTRRQVLC